jgi:hypothetical protein
MARLIQKDAEAARRYMQWAKLSAHMKAMRAPDVSPAFQTRVMGRVKETPFTHRAWTRWALSAVAAALVLVVAGLWRFERQLAGPAGRTPLPSARIEPAANEAVLLAELEERLAAGGDVVLEEPFQETEALDAPDISTDELLIIVASAASFDALVNEVEADEDLNCMLAELNDTESETLEALLSAYAEEDWEL